MTPRRGRELCLVIGRRRLTAFLAGEAAASPQLQLPLDLPTDTADPWPAVATALELLRDQWPELPERVRVVLLPPIAEAKLVSLPRLRTEEARAVLQRDAARHFVGARTPTVVGVELPEEEAGTGPVPVLAVAAPRALTEALHRGIRGLGLRLEAIVPAQSAWLAALRGVEAGEAPRLLVALVEETAHLIRTEEERPDRMRRVPADSPTQIARAAGAGPGRARVLGDADRTAPLLRALVQEGWHPMPGTAGTPEAEAAAHAGAARLELVPPGLAMERRDRSRRMAVRMGVAAALLILVAAGLDLWSAHREVRTVRAERAAIRDEVAPLIARADSLTVIEDRLRTIQELERRSAGWTAALVELAMVLPQDIHLVGFHAAGDTVVIDAVGGRAGDALDALRATAHFHDARLEGSIQRDVEGGAAARERFTLSALRRTSAPTDPSRRLGEGP